VDPDNALIEAWDVAHAGAPWQRPLLLASVLAGGNDGSLLDAPLGAAARQLLELAAAWFGPTLDAMFACRECGEPMEARLEIGSLLEGTPTVEAGPFRCALATGQEVTVRLPTATDLAIAGIADDVSGAMRVLLDRTVVGAPDGFDTRANIDTISRACEERDPLGSITVGVTCPACGAVDEPTLDVGAWFWARADAEAHRLLDEVHLLASAYGWSEHDILALGPHRRAVYRDWVG
jgi:hypothetical protein